MSTENTVLKEAQYSFSSRFASGVGTNPEQLLAAAHAGCFAMAVCSQLGRAGLKPEKLEAIATIRLERKHFAITTSPLDL